jgi:hypothetical protein
MNAKTEGDVLARPLAIDDEAVRSFDRLFITIPGRIPSSRFPDAYDMTTLSPFLIVFPLVSVSTGAVRHGMRAEHRRHPR